MGITSFLDLDPTPDRVEIAGHKTEVPGIDLIGMAHLAKYHPKLGNLFGSGDIIDKLASMDRVSVDAFVAAGMGFPGDEKAEAVAHKLGPHDQLEMITAIVRKTMPRGPGPFAETLATLVKQFVPEPPSNVDLPARKMPQRSPPSPSPNSSDSAIPRAASGA